MKKDGEIIHKLDAKLNQTVYPTKLDNEYFQ